jgi:hypothetical protein
MLQSDIIYTAEARAIDFAGNVSTVYSTYTVTYDTVPPHVTLSTPVQGVVYSQIKLSTPIGGTSDQSDQVSFYSQVSTVTVRISSNPGGVETDFNGAAWVAGPIWLPAQGTVDNWSYKSAALGLSNDIQYRVQVMSVDYAGSSSTVSQAIFAYDIDKPTSTITYPLGATTTGFAQLYGTASDERFGTGRNYESSLGTYTINVAIKRVTATAGWWRQSSTDFGGAAPVWYEVYNATNAGASYPTHFTYTLPTELKANMDLDANEGVTYKLVVWAYDLAQNREYGPNAGQPLEADIPANVGVLVTYDKTPPVARIVVPYDANKSGMRSLPSISGTAFDSLSNKGVQIAIRKFSPTQFWYDGSNFNVPGDPPNWINIVNGVNGTLSPSATSWSYVADGLMDSDFASGYNYQVLVRSSDTAGNVQTQFVVDQSSMVIRVDKELPVSATARPVDDGVAGSGRYKSALIGQTGNSTQFNGTASDPTVASTSSGVNLEQVRLSYLSGGNTYYWTGVAFSSWTVTSTTAWQSANLSGSAPSWTWDYLTSINWSLVGADMEFKLQARAMDDSRLSNDTNDGNWETAYTTKTFIVDDTPPSVLISSPTELSLMSGTTVYGTDNAALSGLNRAEIRLSTGAGAATRYWTGSTWTATVETWINATMNYSTSWYYVVDPATAILKENISYKFEARALDYAGNYSILYDTRTFLNLRPTTVILAPSGAAYNTLTQLNGTAGDAGGISAVQFSIYNTDLGQCYDPSVAGAWKTAGCLSDNNAPCGPRPLPGPTIYRTPAGPIPPTTGSGRDPATIPATGISLIPPPLSSTIRPRPFPRSLIRPTARISISRPSI